MKYVKMQDVFDELASHNKKVFSINDVAKIIGKPKSYVSKLLSNNKRVWRIEKGKYYLKNRTGEVDIYEVASQIVFPSYISMFAAFQFYSITEQSIVRYSVVTIKRHKTIEVRDNTIEFITFNRKRFFGYKKVGDIYIASVEKAIIDSLYMGSPPISYVGDAFSEALKRKLIDIDMLTDMASRMESKALMRRIVALLKSNGIATQKLKGVKHDG